MGTFVVLKGIAFIGDAVSQPPSRARRRVHRRPADLSRRCGGRGRDRAGDRVRLAPQPAPASIPRSASCSPARSRFGVLLFSTIKGYVADLFGYLLGNVLGIGFVDIVQIAFLGGVVLARRHDPQGVAVRHVRSAGAAASGLPVDEARLPPAWTHRRHDRGQHPGRRDHHGRGDAGHAGGDRAARRVRFADLVKVAIGVAVVASVVGLYVSFYFNVASGASIVLVETVFFLAALVLGPRTGSARRARATVSAAAEAA